MVRLQQEKTRHPQVHEPCVLEGAFYLYGFLIIKYFLSQSKHIQVYVIISYFPNYSVAFVLPSSCVTKVKWQCWLYVTEMTVMCMCLPVYDNCYILLKLLLYLSNRIDTNSDNNKSWFAATLYCQKYWVTPFLWTGLTILAVSKSTNLNV